MLAQPISPVAQTREDQSSRPGALDVFAARSTHWLGAFIGLLSAASTLADQYLQEERVDPKACINADHHKAVVDLFKQVDRAAAIGMSLTGAAQLATAGQASVQLWSVLNEQFSACTLPDLLAANDWLRPGDVVYKAETIFRHTLTEADFHPEATAPAKIGGAL